MVDSVQSYFDKTEHAIFKRNFIANVLDGALFAFGMSFVSMHTVLPVFIKKIGGGNIAVGLIPVFWIIGFNFPQIFIAGYVQRFRIKKQLLLKTAMGQRIPWALLAILAYVIIPRVNSQIGLILFFLLFASAAIGGSINLPVWFDMIAKITPVERRGRLFASRLILGAVLGIMGGVIVKYFLETITYPANFGLLFLLAFCMMMISYFFLTILIERKSEVRFQQMHIPEYARALPNILRREQNYRNFLIADALQYLALMGNAFFAIHALEKFSLAESCAGTFTTIMMGSMIIGNLFFGYLADHYGHRLNLIVSAGMIVLSCCLAVTAPTINFYYIVFIGSASTVSLSQISRLPFIAELCSDERRPTYVALTNLISSPFIISGILGGWLATRFGFNMVFVVSAVFALFSLSWLIVLVKEPRKLNTLAHWWSQK